MDMAQMLNERLEVGGEREKVVGVWQGQDFPSRAIS